MSTKNTIDDGRRWAEAVEAACITQKLRLTPARQDVLKILASATGPLGAYGILAEMPKPGGKVAAPPTVYRALEFLLDNGFVHRLESRNAYARCGHVGHAHLGVMLICERCGRSAEVEDAALETRLAAAAKATGFRPSRRVVELQGLCRECSVISLLPLGETGRG